MRRVLVLCSLLVPIALAGCAAVDSTVIAVLAADESSTSQQPLDVDALRERVESTCSGCEVAVFDAGSDAGQQGEQLDRALADGADVVILDPVEAEQGESLVQRAGDVPVVAYATLVPGADWFVGMAVPPTPSEDASDDLDAAREVISRDRDSFTFVPAARMSTRVADVVVRHLADEPVGDAQDHEGVPSWLFEPVEVGVNDLTSVVVRSGAMTLAELCEGETARRCSRLGLV